MKRRRFVTTTVGAGAAASLGAFDWPGKNEAGEENAPPSWIDRPMRWAQLTLVEDDPGKFDLQFWLDYFARTKSDAVCLSGGGCVAYYPTQVPYHHRSAWLEGRDVLGELITGCRKLGMVVVGQAQFPPRGVERRRVDEAQVLFLVRHASRRLIPFYDI